MQTEDGSLADKAFQNENGRMRQLLASLSSREITRKSQEWLAEQAESIIYACLYVTSHLLFCQVGGKLLENRGSSVMLPALLVEAGVPWHQAMPPAANQLAGRGT